MKNFILALWIVCSCFVLNAQEKSKKETLDSFIKLIEKSHSTLCDSAFYVVKNSNDNGLRLELQSFDITPIYKIFYSTTI